MCNNSSDKTLNINLQKLKKMNDPRTKYLRIYRRIGILYKYME